MTGAPRPQLVARTCLGPGTLCVPSARGSGSAAIGRKGAGQDSWDTRSGLKASLSPAEALGTSRSATVIVSHTYLTVRVRGDSLPQLWGVKG